MYLSSLNQITRTPDRQAAEQVPDASSQLGLGNRRRAVSHLLSAAVVNRHFAQTLLREPALALERGYANQQFNFTEAERQAIAAICADNLQEFAAELINLFSLPRTTAHDQQ